MTERLLCCLEWVVATAPSCRSRLGAFSHTFTFFVYIYWFIATTLYNNISLFSPFIGQLASERCIVDSRADGFPRINRALRFQFPSFAWCLPLAPHPVTSPIPRDKIIHFSPKLSPPRGASAHNASLAGNQGNPSVLVGLRRVPKYAIARSFLFGTTRPKDKEGKKGKGLRKQRTSARVFALRSGFTYPISERNRMGEKLASCAPVTRRRHHRTSPCICTPHPPIACLRTSPISQP
jgi:hypothetical protein